MILVIAFSSFKINKLYNFTSSPSNFVNQTEMRLLENDKLDVSNELIKRHLISFDKSFLLDRLINIHQDFVYKHINKCDHELKEWHMKRLANLQNDKQETIKNTSKLYNTFQKNDILLGKDNTERLNSISFYLLMLQNEENAQTRRLFVFAEKNPVLSSLSENVSILDDKPAAYIQKQTIINKTLQFQQPNSKRIKLQNQIINFAENHTPAIILKDYFKGKSALILSNEDKLTEYTDWIERNQEHFIIIALSHLAKALLGTKIKPDIFIAEIFNESSFENNKAIIYFEESTLLINQNYLLPKILCNWLGVNCYLGDIFPWSSQLNIKNISFDNFNNSNSLISFASFLGINKHIIFSQSSPENNQLNSFKVPEEKTSISEFLHKQITKHENTEYKIKHYQQILNEINVKLVRLKDKKQQNKEFEKELIGDTFNVLKNNGEKQLTKYIYDAILRTEVRLLENNALTINNDLVTRHLSKANNLILGQSPLTKQEIINRKNVKKEFLNQPNKRKLATHFYLVLSYNGVNYATRRIYKFLEGKSDFINIPEETLVIKQTAEVLFDRYKPHAADSLFSLDTTVLEKTKFEGLEVKLYNLFILNDEKAITKIIKGIELIEEDNSIKNSYLHLARGYNYELNKQTEQAIEEYGQADDSATRESALKRIALISLEKGDMESTYNTLLILSEISPVYMLQIADLCILTKNYKDALDAYTHYLDYNPSDISILFKVARLYEDQNIEDGAQFIYKQILTLEPENLIAKKQLEKI